MTVAEIKENLQQQPLPKYSKGEERFNFISHGIGIALGLVALGTFIALAIIFRFNVWETLSLIFFSLSMILLYATSTIYHALPVKSVWKKLFRLNRAFAINRISQSIHHAPKQAHSDRHRKQTAGGLDLIAFFQAADVTENNTPDLALVEVERLTDDPPGKLDHFIIHDVRQSFDPGHAIGDRDDVPDVLFADCGFEIPDLVFNGFDYGAHQ